MTKMEEAVETLKKAILEETRSKGISHEEITVVTMYQLAHYGVVKIDNKEVKHTRIDVEELAEGLKNADDELSEYAQEMSYAERNGL